MYRAAKQIFITILVATAFVSLTAAQPAAHRKARTTESPLDGVTQALLHTRTFDQVAISPDGQRVAWVEQLAEKYRSIHVSNAKPGAVERTLGPANTEDAVAWSPDSRWLAFLSDKAKPGQMQLYIMNAASGVERKLTNVTGFLSTPGFSPDGKIIAVLLTENATRAAGPLVAETAQTGVIQEAVTEQRLALVDVASGKLRQISPTDMYVYEFDWSPDGQRLATTAAHGNGDNNWYIAQLYIIQATGGEMTAIYTPEINTQIAAPTWSPDGESVGFIGGLMSDEGSVGGDVFVISREGGRAWNVTSRMKASASAISWSGNGHILLGEKIDGGSGLALVDVKTGKIESVYQTGDTIGAGANEVVSLAADGKTSAIYRESLTQPPEIWTGPIGSWQKITSRNPGLKAPWGEAKSIHWTNDGFNLQGWLLYPRDFDPAKKYPMVVLVHGGPSSIIRSKWPDANSFGVAMAATGYFVFMPNFRGSYGNGEAFARANVKDFGYGDFRDIMTGVDQALKDAPIDEHRLGVTGWSYGGYMSMWIVTQTHRFAATVIGAGLANFQSYYGENQIDKWMVPFFGATVYDDPQVYARSSPITFIKNVKTPSLLFVGDSDGECPPPQSYEFWHALKTLGVETELVVYAHEGHRFMDPAHQKDKIVRARAWFDKYLK